MCQMTVNKQEKFNGDRTIGGAVTVKKPSKTQYSIVHELNCKKQMFIYSHIH